MKLRKLLAILTACVILAGFATISAGAEDWDCEADGHVLILGAPICRHCGFSDWDCEADGHVLIPGTPICWVCGFSDWDCEAQQEHILKVDNTCAICGEVGTDHGDNGGGNGDNGSDNGANGSENGSENGSGTEPEENNNPDTGVVLPLAAVLIAGGIAAVTRKRR